MRTLNDMRRCWFVLLAACAEEPPPDLETVNINVAAVVDVLVDARSFAAIVAAQDTTAVFARIDHFEARAQNIFFESAYVSRTPPTDANPTCSATGCSISTLKYQGSFSISGSELHVHSHTQQAAPGPPLDATMSLDSAVSGMIKTDDPLYTGSLTIQIDGAVLDDSGCLTAGRIAAEAYNSNIPDPPYGFMGSLDVRAATCP